MVFWLGLDDSQIIISYGCFQEIGGTPPKWMVKIMVPNPIKIDDLGGKNHPLFFGNPDMISSFCVQLKDTWVNPISSDRWTRRSRASKKNCRSLDLADLFSVEANVGVVQRYISKSNSDVSSDVDIDM